MAKGLPRNRKYPFGAECQANRVDFRVWAPRHRRVELFLPDSDQRIPMAEEEDGFFYVSPKLKHARVDGIDADVQAELGKTDDNRGPFPSGMVEVEVGTRYFYRLGEDLTNYPDPASRYQPEGVHGPSVVVDPSEVDWTDGTWRGVELAGQVIYELHLGCFTPEGTWKSAEEKLPHLVETGVTVVEIMPVAEFDGQFGWGYDGVQWYAPTRLYGAPADFKRFVNKAHHLGIAVILDVVYNHFGPTGNYLGAFSNYVVSKRHPTDWGEAINFDGEECEHVRSFVVSNAAYWIEEFHLDGLRLDATQAIYDDSPRHLVSDLSVACRTAAGKDRKIIIVAENEDQDVRHVESVENGGFGLDGLWNDDFHHACRVAATGHAEFYYADYAGSPQELISATRYGYLYQGQYTPRRDRYRGTPCWHVEGHRFITYLQNHDQVANSAAGLRLPQQTSPGRYRALTTFWLLGPGTPMLFMGQEFAARNPFRYFADHEVEVAKLVRDGRWEALRQFPRIAGWDGATIELPDPADRSTFNASKLNWDDLQANAHDFLLHRDLLKLRRADPVFARQNKQLLQGAVIGPECFLLRWHDEAQDDRLLIVNLGRDFQWHPASEPLIAPPQSTRWQLKFSSEDPIYGGSGTAMLTTKHWQLPGHAAILLAPVRK